MFTNRYWVTIEKISEISVDGNGTIVTPNRYLKRQEFVNFFGNNDVNMT